MPFTVLSLGNRPLLEKLKFDDDVHKERFLTVKQLLEACWNRDSDKRPTIETVLSCFIVNEANMLHLSPLYEDIELSKHNLNKFLLLIELVIKEIYTIAIN